MDVDGQAQAAKDPYALSQEIAYRVMKSTMDADVEADAIKVARAAVDKYQKVGMKDVAQFAKVELDRLHPPGRAEGVFHAIVGKSFASAVGHETRAYIHLKVEQLNVILWQDAMSFASADA